VTPAATPPPKAKAKAKANAKHDPKPKPKPKTKPEQANHRRSKTAPGHAGHDPGPTRDAGADPHGKAKGHEAHVPAPSAAPPEAHVDATGHE
jgi:hypothetical protein